MIETRMMLGSVLGIAVARPLQARSAAPRMVISASPTIAEYPSPALSPWDVVASQISALQAEDNVRTFRFASPEGKRTTGTMKEVAERSSSVSHYFSPPTYRDMPT